MRVSLLLAVGLVLILMCDALGRIWWKGEFYRGQVQLQFSGNERRLCIYA